MIIIGFIIDVQIHNIIHMMCLTNMNPLGATVFRLYLGKNHL